MLVWVVLMIIADFVMACPIHSHSVLVARNRFSACSTLPWMMRLLRNSRGALCRYDNAEQNFNFEIELCTQCVSFTRHRRV